MVDKYGRTVTTSKSNDDLRRFYRLDDGTNEGDGVFE